MSKKPLHIFTPSQIDEMYDDWLHSIEDEVDIAHRYGFHHATTMRKFLEANGKPTVNVKTATCPICGETFAPNRSHQKYCSLACQRYSCNTSAKEFRAEQQAERERRIKERFFGYSKIAAICIAAKAEGLSYGQYVGKYNL